MNENFTVPRMILPERTVDMWTATYLTGRCWRARIWAPAERQITERYDLAVGLAQVGAAGSGAAGPGGGWPEKVFVLEHKGVGPGRSVRIPRRQLEIHLAADEAVGGDLVYYLLPALAAPGETPHRVWAGSSAAPYGGIPAPASHRLRGPEWPGFQRWAVIVNVRDLNAELRGNSAYAAQLRGGAATIPIGDLWHLPAARSLRDFVSAVRRCECGRRAGDAELVSHIRRFAESGERSQVAEEGAEDDSRTSFYGVGGVG